MGTGDACADARRRGRRPRHGLAVPRRARRPRARWRSVRTVVVARRGRPELRRGHDAGQRLRQNLIRLGGGNTALAGRARVRGHRRLHDAQGPCSGGGGQSLLDRRASTRRRSAGFDQGLPTALSRATGLSRGPSLVLASAGVALVPLAFVFKDARFRGPPAARAGRHRARPQIVAGRYVATPGLRREPRHPRGCNFCDEHARSKSLSFVAPAAYTLRAADAVDRTRRCT